MSEKNPQSDALSRRELFAADAEPAVGLVSISVSSEDNRKAPRLNAEPSCDFFKSKLPFCPATAIISASTKQSHRAETDRVGYIADHVYSNRLSFYHGQQQASTSGTKEEKFMSENVQIYPARTRVVPNSKLIKQVCNLTDKEYEDCVVNKKQRGVIEKRNHKKHGKIITPYQIRNVDGNTDPLNEFDHAVFNVCNSEFEAGNHDTTPSIIYRSLSGKIGDSDANPSKNQREAILNSVKKLMTTLIWIRDDETNEKLKYAPTDLSRQWRNILYAGIDEKIVNGQDATVIHIFQESPLMTIAKNRDQIIRYDATILNVPNQNNTPMNIAIKNYVINRVVEIKAHNMTSTLTFVDIFEKVRITNASRKTKMDARNVVKTFFEHLQAKGVIKSFEVVKKGVSDHSITFTF